MKLGKGLEGCICITLDIKYIAISAVKTLYSFPHNSDKVTKVFIAVCTVAYVVGG